MHPIVYELILVFGVVFGWGFYELWSLRRDRLRKERETAELEKELAERDRNDV